MRQIRIHRFITGIRDPLLGGESDENSRAELQRGAFRRSLRNSLEQRLSCFENSYSRAIYLYLKGKTQSAETFNVLAEKEYRREGAFDVHWKPTC